MNVHLANGECVWDVAVITLVKVYRLCRIQHKHRIHVFCFPPRDRQWRRYWECRPRPAPCCQGPHVPPRYWPSSRYILGNPGEKINRDFGTVAWCLITSKFRSDGYELCSIIRSRASMSEEKLYKTLEEYFDRFYQLNWNFMRIWSRQEIYTKVRYELDLTRISREQCVCCHCFFYSWFTQDTW